MNEHQFQAILLENLRDAVVATDLDGVINYWNDGAERVFGYTAEEAIGRTPHFLYPDQDYTRLSTDLEQIDGGVDYVGEWRGTRKDGSPVWVDVTTTMVRDSSGNPIGYVGISRDITERKRLEQEVSRLLASEREAHQQLRRFFALVAHDLHQPLTVIRSATQLLQRESGTRDSDGSSPYLRMLDDAVKRIQRFARDLLDASQIGANQFAVQPGDVNLAEVLQIVVEHAQVSSHRILLHSPGEVRGWWDRDRLTQLFHNLISNATKYSPEGSDVVVSVDQQGDEVVIQVADSGPGIPAEEQEALFQAFTRLDAGSAGTGLGLYISRGIVEAHAGRIWVDSEPGQGSRFFVALPLQVPSHPAADTVYGAYSGGSGGSDQSSGCCDHPE